MQFLREKIIEPLSSLLHKYPKCNVLYFRMPFSCITADLKTIKLINTSFKILSNKQTYTYNLCDSLASYYISVHVNSTHCVFVYTANTWTKLGPLQHCNIVNSFLRALRSSTLFSDSRKALKYSAVPHAFSCFCFSTIENTYTLLKRLKGLSPNIYNSRTSIKLPNIASV